MDDLTSLTDLTEDEAIEVAQKLLAQLEGEAAKVEAGERRMAGIRKWIDGLVEMYPAVEDELPEDFDDAEQPRPRGAQAALRVLMDRPGKAYSVSNIVETLDQYGWAPQSSNPANAVRTALERLVKDGKVWKGKSSRGTGEVIYGYPDPNTKKPATAASDYDQYGEEPF
jgi:hypothetical protein